jgi:hypothetical protein
VRSTEFIFSNKNSERKSYTDRAPDFYDRIWVLLDWVIDYPINGYI